jgi:DNA-3-methyladenine glycosylase II
MTWHKNDPHMTRLVNTLPPPKKSAKSDLYLALVGSVVSQQLSTKAADTIFRRFCALFPDNYPDAAAVLRKRDTTLRAAGLSGQKVNYIRNIAAFHVDTPMTKARLGKLDDDAVIDHLTQIKGVGKWTVQMLLMFPMDRPNVFPIDDLGIRHAMIDLYGLDKGARSLYDTLHTIAAAWEPNRTLACKYLWAARDSKII